MRHLLVISLLLAAAMPAQEIRPVEIVSGLSDLTDIQNAADGTGRLFFVQQHGVIRTFSGGKLLIAPFLDIRKKTRLDGERGLLGLAFPPGYATKRRFYLDYTDLNGDTIIAQYQVLAGSEVGDPDSERVLLKIAQPFANHNGGQLRFGPDGYLYIGMGDGGSAGDPQGNGQKLGTLLGKLLRIDVESSPGEVRIPPDNPFVNTAGARGEIWAYGLRNPWRFSFDRVTRDLWIADVGQDTYEEVDFQPAASRGGENYGWNTMEGMHCFQANCQTQGLTLPVVEYTHAAGGCSVTGGFVYRGRLSPSLRGIYFYADYCSGRIWGLERRDNAWNNRQLLASGLNITTFGEDEAGEVYLSGAATGSVYRLEGGSAPRYTAAGIVNAANFAPGMVGGSLATVFAVGVRDDPGSAVAGAIPLPVALDGVSVTVDGFAVPILSVSNVNGQEQVNFQAPFALAGRSTAQVAVARNSVAGPAVTVPVFPVQPAVYTTDGTHAIVVHNATYTLATPAQPLVAGEFAFLYASGLGPVANQPKDGEGAPLSAPALADVRLTLGGVACELQYAGLAPGFVGVYQVNFRVPAIPAGDLVLTANGVSLPPVQVVAR